jgi:hypothetical protein
VAGERERAGCWERSLHKGARTVALVALVLGCPSVTTLGRHGQ